MTKREAAKIARALNRCRAVLLEALQGMTPVERAAQEDRYGLATTADQLYHTLATMDQRESPKL